MNKKLLSRTLKIPRSLLWLGETPCASSGWVQYPAASKVRDLFLIFICCLVIVFLLKPNLVLAQNKKVEIYFFWGQGCPHCAQEKPFLEELQKKYPQLEVKSFEVYYDQGNQNLFQKIAKAYNTSTKGVPMTFIGSDFVTGFNAPETTGQEIERLIKNCLSSICLSPQQILEAGGLSSLGIGPNKNQLVCIHYFIQDNCLPCQRLMPYLETISKKYKIDLKIYNISQDKTSQALYDKLHEFYKLSFSGFPMVFLGNSYLLGDIRIRQNLETLIVRCQKQGCLCPVEGIKTVLTQMPPTSTFTPGLKEKIPLVLFGKKIDLSSHYSLPVLGMILGLIDGINPCMLSVLLFLLTYLLAISSRKKVIKVGLVFILGVFIVYFLFMLGLLNVIAFIGFIQKVKIIVAIIALAAGLIMIKDFFFYGKWFSLEIPKSSKPVIEKLIRKGTIPSAIALAFLSSLVELPCSSGIPLVYVTLLAQKGGPSILYLLWYNLFFVVPLFLIMILITLAWAQVDKIEKWRLAFRKYMRLVAGLILVFLAMALFSGWM